MKLCYIGKAARKKAQIRRPDKAFTPHPASVHNRRMRLRLSVLQNRLFRQNPPRAQKMVLPERFG